MKKLIICVVLALTMLVGVANDESIDLSSMTYEELVELKDKINLAILVLNM